MVRHLFETAKEKKIPHLTFTFILCVCAWKFCKDFQDQKSVLLSFSSEFFLANNKRNTQTSY